MAFYVLDENKNLVLSFDAEGFLAILQQAIADQSLANIDPDSAVASKLRSIINGTAHHIEFITAAQYNDLEAHGELVEGTYYFITDDTTEQDLEEAVSGLVEGVGTLNTRTETLEGAVQNLNQSVGALGTSKLDKSVYDADFVIGDPWASGSQTGWEDYDTTVGLSVSAGLYLCSIINQSASVSAKQSSVLILVTQGVSYDDISPVFPLNIGGTLYDCYLTAKNVSGQKAFKVFRKDNGNEVDCFIEYHKIGSIV